LNAQKQTLDDEIATITADVEDKLTTAATETDQKIAETDKKIGTVQGDLKTGLEAVTASITTVVKPQIDEVKEIVGDILKALLGSNSAMAADNCAAIKSAAPLSSDNYYWIKNQGAVVKVFCKVVSGNFVSMGGDGTSKASAAAGCEGHALVENNDAVSKWVDPDANAENTGNAVQKRCMLYTCK